MNDDRVDWREGWALFAGEVACLHATTVAVTCCLIACRPTAC
jgi:hypothetical protein